MAAPSHLRPSDEDLALLDRFERVAFELADLTNSRPLLKGISHRWLRHGNVAWVHACTRNLVHVVGIDEMRALRPDRAVLLCANHRSFFDMYIASAALFRETDLIQRLFFPVRANFFYDRPAGVLVNLIMSGLGMYPPLFRERRKWRFNRYALARIQEILRQPGTVMGVHPEGTRNRGADPYQLLPFQPGVGRMIMDARPIVVPTFINGLTNDFIGQIRSNFDGTGAPVIIVFGRPMDLSRFYGERNALRTHKAIADAIAARILELAEVERSLRARLADRPRRGPATYPLPPGI